MKVKLLVLFLICTSLVMQITPIMGIEQRHVIHKELMNPELSGCGTSFVKETVMIPMRDGVKLATDVYLPNEISSSHSAIIIRTPYNKNGWNLGGWADAGWPSLVQDMRGRYASEGRDRVFRKAHVDGPDTFEWIAHQNWSNGKVVTYGGSAMGIHQYYLAGANPPQLCCQYISVASPNLHKHAIYQGGEFRKNMVEGWLQGQGSTYILPELWEHENYTMNYWTNVSLDDNWSDVNIPAIHIGGWYDCFAQGIIDGFMGYQYHGGGGARGKSKLIMGPWTHGGFGRTRQGELDYPINALDTFSWEMFVEMIEEYAHDGSDDFDHRPNVSYYVMGDVDDEQAPGNTWRFAESWPVPYAERTWYFYSNGDLSTVGPDTVDSSRSFTYNPQDPVPTIGGQNLILPSGPYDQQEIENRGDVLVFTSEPLSMPYEATGPITARLYVSSDCPDTDFTVKLTDVYPDGHSMLITDGILRMRNREGFDHWEFMEPSDIYEVEVDLWSTSYIWNTGHRIRVAVSSSNYPRFLNNPNTRDGIYQNEGNYNIAHNTVYVNNLYPSCLILPEVTSPLVAIIKPQDALYLNNKEIWATLVPIAIGPIEIIADVYDIDDTVEQVLFYIDNAIVDSVESEPYRYYWDGFSFGKHAVTVRVVDSSGTSAEDELVIWKFF